MGEEYTVVVGTARGAFTDIEEAKDEARRLFAMNSPEPVTVLDKGGHIVFQISQTSEDDVT